MLLKLFAKPYDGIMFNASLYADVIRQSYSAGLNMSPPFVDIVAAFVLFSRSAINLLLLWHYSTLDFHLKTRERSPNCTIRVESKSEGKFVHCQFCYLWILPFTYNSLALQVGCFLLILFLVYISGVFDSVLEACLLVTFLSFVNDLGFIASRFLVKNIARILEKVAKTVLQ